MTKPRQTVRPVPLAAILAHPRNARDRLGDLTELADSIKEHGLLQPVVVTEHPTDFERFLLLAGHRRVVAAKIAGLTSVPAVIRHGIEYDESEQTVVMLVENCQRRDLDPIERAHAFDSLRKQGLPQAEIARRTGISASVVSHHLRLLVLDAASQQRIRDGRIGITTAHAEIVAARQGSRSRNGSASRGRPVVVEPAHFTKRHRLAGEVRDLCTHTARPSVGGVGCGQCWEAAIRADASREVDA